MTTFNDLFTILPPQNDKMFFGDFLSENIKDFYQIGLHHTVANSFSQNINNECIKLLNSDERFEIRILIDNKYINGCYEKYGKKLITVFFDKKPLLVGLFSGSNQSVFSFNILDKSHYDSFVNYVLELHIKTLPAEEIEYIDDFEQIVKPEDDAKNLWEYALNLD